MPAPRGGLPAGSTAWRLGLAGQPGALGYGIIAMINMAWPRTPDVPWYDNYIVALSAVIVIGIGLVYMLVAKPYDRGDAPHGDAIEMHPEQHDRMVHAIEKLVELGIL